MWNNRRKNGTIKRILDMIGKADKASNKTTLIAKAAFMSNFLHVSMSMSSLELARGYAPSIVGNPAHQIQPDILLTHKNQAARRAVQNLLR